MLKKTEKKKENERRGHTSAWRRKGKKRDVSVFYIKGREKKKKKNRHVCYEMWDSSFFIRAFYRYFYRRIIKY
jgi:hypothetical protein